MDMTQTPKVQEETTTAAKEFAARTMSLLGPLTNRDLQAGFFHPEAMGEPESSFELIRKLAELFIAVLKSTLEFRMRSNGTEFFWPRPNNVFDEETVTPHKRTMTQEDGR